MRFSLNATSAVVIALAVAPLISCAEDDKRPLGANCAASAQCVSNICGGGTCLDPAVDTDTDGLINQIEAALGTDPVSRDTDMDGIEDKDEIGDDTNAPLDEDGDGRIDALESVLTDCDGDMIVDQKDADDGVDAKGVCTAGLSTAPLAACDDVCRAASRAGCEGFMLAGCVTECRDFLANVPPQCGGPFVQLATCVAEDEITCADPLDSGNEHLPEIGDECDAQVLALAACADGGPVGRDCTNPTNQAVGIPAYYRESNVVYFFFNAVAGVGYSVTVTPDPDVDFDLFVYADVDAMCSLGGQDIGASTNPAGDVEVVTVPPLADGGARYLKIDNFTGGDVGFELSITELIQR